MDSANGVVVGLEAFKSYEDPAGSWIDLVAALKCGDPSVAHACLQIAKESHWTHSQWEIAMQLAEEEDDPDYIPEDCIGCSPEPGSGTKEERHPNPDEFYWADGIDPSITECNDCMDRGECGSSDGCCGCTCHQESYMKLQDAHRDRQRRSLFQKSREATKLRQLKQCEIDDFFEQ